MSACNPLPSELISPAYQSFTGRWSYRNATLFILQCYTGFRAAEILSLRVGDVRNSAGKIEDVITVKAQNMKGSARSRSIRLNDDAYKILCDYMRWLADHDYILSTDPLWPKDNGQPLTYAGMYKVYKEAFARLGLHRGYATHTARKTFAVNHHNNLLSKFQKEEIADNPLLVLCKLMGHADIRATIKYLPEPECINQSINEVTFKL